MKKFVTSIILFVLLFSLSISTFAHEGHAPSNSTSHEHEVTSKNWEGMKYYPRGEIVHGLKIPQGIVFLLYNDTDEVITETRYLSTFIKNEYYQRPTIAFPDSKIEALMRVRNSDFTLGKIIYESNVLEISVPPGKTRVVTSYDLYNIYRLELLNTEYYHDRFYFFGERTIKETGHALIKKYRITVDHTHTLDGEYTYGDILSNPSLLLDNVDNPDGDTEFPMVD